MSTEEELSRDPYFQKAWEEWQAMTGVERGGYTRWAKAYGYERGELYYYARFRGWWREPPTGKT